MLLCIYPLQPVCTFLLILLLIKSTVYCPAHLISLHILLLFTSFFHTYIYVYSLVFVLNFLLVIFCIIMYMMNKNLESWIIVIIKGISHSWYLTLVDTRYNWLSNPCISNSFIQQQYILTFWKELYLLYIQYNECVTHCTYDECATGWPSPYSCSTGLLLTPQPQGYWPLL